MSTSSVTIHNELIEATAQLLHERIQLGRGVPPVHLDTKEPWKLAFETYLNSQTTTDETNQRNTSTSYYALLGQLLDAWYHVDQQPITSQADTDRLYRLDALFDLLESRLLDMEKVSMRQRLIFPTQYGLFILGTRPLLAYETDKDERAPMDVDRLYRRFNLLTDSPVDPTRDIIDGIRYADAGARMNRSNTLNIGLAALSGGAATHFEPTGRFADLGKNSRFGFLSSDVLPQSVYEQELRSCIDWAIAEHIHILCLPELSVCRNGRAILQAHLAQRNSQNPLTDLVLIVAGSYHVDRFNEAPVWLVDKAGQLVEFTYRKHEAFEVKLPDSRKAPVAMKQLIDYASTHGLESCYIREDIASDDSILLLNLPVGLVGVIICKDFLNPDYYRHYNAFEPDYLLIVSMNTKPGEFIQTWRRYPKRHAMTAGFYVNATQVISPTDAETEVIFWGVPAATNRFDHDSRVYVRQPSADRQTLDKQPSYEPLPDHGRLRVSIPLLPSSRTTSPNLPSIGAK